MNIKRDQKNKVWIALATVTPKSGNLDLGDAKAAAVNVLHLASSPNEFVKKVTDQLNTYGFELTEIEDVEEFDFRGQYKDNLKELAKAVRVQNTLQWGTFYTFDE